LEEEALLQEIEEKPSCPGCAQRVQPDWQVCAYCHTRLKKPCVACHNLLELSWNLCPFCATPQRYEEPDMTGFGTGLRDDRVTLSREEHPAAHTARATGQLEFVDGEDY
jgi:RNA polymerase subunit RPABC4/transcription elongation factor Spt4